MRYHTFGEDTGIWETAILIKDSSMDYDMVKKYYINQLAPSTNIDQIIAYSLKYTNNKVTAKEARTYLTDDLLPTLDSLGIKYIYCADAAYFKVLTGNTKADKFLGSKTTCAIKGYEHLTVVYGVNYGSLLHNPSNLDKLTLSIKTILDVINDDFEQLGKDILKYVSYPEHILEINSCLRSLDNMDYVACDIETFGLNPFTCGIGSIAFAINTNTGFSFLVDKTNSKDKALKIRNELKQFFENYKGRIRFHNPGFDIKVLIRQLWMKHDLDFQGLQEGLAVFEHNIDDTMAIAYLALNTASGELELSLKSLAHEYAGNYAQSDIHDINLIPDKELLEYNLTDTLCTNYVYDKYYPMMVADNQLEFYQTMMMPIIHLLYQTELIGMPMNVDKLEEVKDKLSSLSDRLLEDILSNQYVNTALDTIKDRKLEKKNSKLKKIQHTIDVLKDEKFNPNSNQHLQVLLYEVMDLPIIDFTKTKQPATGNKTIEKLQMFANPAQKHLLGMINEYTGTMKILSTFIPAFENGVLKADGRRYLHGSFRYGAKSGRLVSFNPKQHWALRK